MRNLIFTIAVTFASRTLMLRDRLCGLPRKTLQDSKSVTSSTRCRIPSGDNLLDAILFQPSDCPAAASVLICHGIGEIVSHWQAAQTLLAEYGIASLVFDYSGYGRSTGHIAAAQCERDAIAAFRYLQQLTPAQPVSLLGYSLGSAIAAEISMKVHPHSLVLCAAFTSLRKAAQSVGFPRPLAQLLPDIWKTGRALRACTQPVLIVHGEKDRLFPWQMARELADFCVSPCRLVVVTDLTHNAPIYHPQSTYWALIASWIGGRSSDSGSMDRGSIQSQSIDRESIDREPVNSRKKE